MPVSSPPTAVDHVVDMEQIGPLLFDILRGVNLPATEKADNPLGDLLTQVSAQTNIDFSQLQILYHPPPHRAPHGGDSQCQHSGLR